MSESDTKLPEEVEAAINEALSRRTLFAVALPGNERVSARRNSEAARAALVAAIEQYGQDRYDEGATGRNYAVLDRE